MIRLTKHFYLKDLENLLFENKWLIIYAQELSFLYYYFTVEKKTEHG